jgi:enoyl-CoA hydratase
MPEAVIGFFPDVGATHFLNRLPGNLGLCMALTGALAAQPSM